MARRGFPGGMGGMNIGKLMKEAQKIQTDMKKSQEEIAGKTFEATSGGSAVKVKMSGKRVLENIDISQELIESNDKEMIEDLVTLSINDALNQIAKAEEEMTSGLNIPGLGL